MDLQEHVIVHLDPLTGIPDWAIQVKTHRAHPIKNNISPSYRELLSMEHQERYNSAFDWSCWNDSPTNVGQLSYIQCM